MVNAKTIIIGLSSIQTVSFCIKFSFWDLYWTTSLGTTISRREVLYLDFLAFWISLAWLGLIVLAGTSWPSWNSWLLVTSWLARTSWPGWDFLAWLRLFGFLGLLGLAGTSWLSGTPWHGWDFVAWLGLLSFAGTSWPDWNILAFWKFLAWLELFGLAESSWLSGTSWPG